jgi:hypothetical protein
MLGNLLRAGPRLSRGVVRLVTCACAMLYVIVFVNASTFLPEFIFRDAEKIQAQMDGATTYEGTSFDAVASFYGWFGPTPLKVMVVAVGVLFIVAMLARANRVGMLAAALVLCVPCVFFNLFVASKDTLVVMIALLIANVARGRRAALVPVVALVAYVGYALLVRRYFLLIVLIAGGIALWHRASTRWKLVLAIAVGGGLALLPTSVYFLLLHPRDMAVDYLVYQSPFGARTGFYNPLVPESFAAFCGDYLYASARLHLALLFSPGVKELAMQGFVLLALWPAWRNLRATKSRHAATAATPHRLVGETLACLVMAHVAVSMLFEPDLGSYIRHLSSVALFSMLLLGASDGNAASGQRRYGVPAPTVGGSG